MNTIRVFTITERVCWRVLSKPLNWMSLEKRNRPSPGMTVPLAVKDLRLSSADGFGHEQPAC
jgi:hypothetical protein